MKHSIDYFVWLMSDWAYFGGVRLEQLAIRHDLAIRYIPMRMQDVYAASGGILLHQRSWQRQAYRVEELRRWSVKLAMPINIEPKFFPADVDAASCMVIAAQRKNLAVGPFVNVLLRALWVEDQDLSDREGLVRLAERCGLDGTYLLAAADDDDTKEEYRSNTERALTAGVFGSPFYVLGNETFWGQDRLDMLEDAVVRLKGADLGRRPKPQSL
jgi:2-hydroxychromene-2-carboxylate isomerase